MPALAPVLRPDDMPADVSVLVCVGLADELVLEGADVSVDIALP